MIKNMPEDEEEFVEPRISLLRIFDQNCQEFPIALHVNHHFRVARKMNS